MMVTDCDDYDGMIIARPRTSLVLFAQNPPALRGPRRALLPRRRGNEIVAIFESRTSSLSRVAKSFLLVARRIGLYEARLRGGGLADGVVRRVDRSTETQLQR